MEKPTNNPLWIYIFALIGMISYLLFAPLTLNASELSQSDATTSQFDMALLYWAIGIIGGFILVTLIYVGFRKYKGEKKKEERHKKNQHDQEKG